MLTKRRTANESERYVDFDTVIEVDEVKAKSFGAAQTAAADNLTYTTRKETESINRHKTDDEVMPKIRRTEKPVVQAKTKQALNFKTKVLLTAYLALAIVLAAAVIATGIAVSNSAKKVDALQNQLYLQNNTVGSYTDKLELLSDKTYNTGRAVENDFEKIDEIEKIKLIEYSEPIVFAEKTNGFDSFCEFISRLFS